MPRYLTNLLLLITVGALVATGLLGWVLPESRALPFYDAHRALGVGLLLLLVWKQAVVRFSLRRRLRGRRWDRSTLIGVAAGVALLGSLGLGLAWSLNLVSFAAFSGYSPLNVHVYLALAVLPFLVWHLARRWEPLPPAKQLFSRRTALRLLVLSAASVFSWQLLDRTLLAWASEGSRRSSGSKHAGSFSGNDFPVTNWLFDPVPTLDPATWRLHITGKVAQGAALTYPDLLSQPQRRVQAVLDCTGGWWSEQLWTGVPLLAVLATRGLAATARSVEVVSVTGHRWGFPLGELDDALLATHVGAEPLSPGHGHPVRLVVPGRRGFQWIKWVESVEVF